MGLFGRKPTPLPSEDAIRRLEDEARVLREENRELKRKLESASYACTSERVEQEIQTVKENCLKLRQELEVIKEEKAPSNEPTNQDEYIVLGKYPQGAGGEVKPIEWKILDIEDGVALVISRYALSIGRYDRGNDKYVPWEKCSLRHWLNYPFFNAAFSEKEKEIIQYSHVCNGADQGNPAFGKSGGPDTSDRMFLLSYAEAQNLFSSDEDRLCIPTPYAVSLGACTDEDTLGGEAWLRSPGSDDYLVSVISPFGNLSCDGADGNMSVVRPAMRIRINS